MGLTAERLLPPAKVEKEVSICWVYLILPKLVPIDTKELLSAEKKRKRFFKKILKKGKKDRKQTTKPSFKS